MNYLGANVICGGLTFEEVPVELREKVAFRDAQLPDALAQMRDDAGPARGGAGLDLQPGRIFRRDDEPDRAAEAWPDFLREFHAVTDDFSPLLVPDCAGRRAWSISIPSRRA